MTRPSRARRILKWTGASLSLIVFLSAWATAHWYSGLLCAYPYVEFGDGVLSVEWHSPLIQGVAFTPSVEVERSTGTWGLRLPEVRVREVHWTLTVDQALGKSPIPPRTRSYQFVIPLWIPSILSLCLCGLLWHRDRGWRRPGCCLRCGYDLTGNTSGVCSECGLPKPPPATAAPEKSDR